MITNSDSQSSNNEILINKTILANTLENSGELAKAIEVYQEIIQIDREGTYGSVARKALEKLEASQIQPLKTEIKTTPATVYIQKKPENTPLLSRLLQGFYNLPIRSKQLAAILGLQAISLGGLIMGTYLIIENGRNQFLKQVAAELAIVSNDYNTKITQMQSGMLGLGENPVVIDSAYLNKSQKDLKTLLIREIWRSDLELLTLVSKNNKLLATANIFNQGQDFNPENLVTEALNSGEQITSSELITYDELAADSPRFAELRARDLGLDPSTKPNFLIRYVVTPVRLSNSDIVGALVAGDIVKLPVISDNIEQFENVYSGVFLKQPDGSLTLATSQLKDENNTNGVNVPFPDSQFLASALEAREQPIKTTVKFGPRVYYVAAQPILNFQGEPIGVLVRGISEQSLNQLIFNSVGLQALVLLLGLLVSLALASLLVRSLVKPLERLKQVAQKFSEGNRQVRAKVTSTDEIGELAKTFNAMADSIVVSEKNLEEQSRQQAAEAVKQRQTKENLQKEVIQLLMDIEGAQKGDLTVKAQLTEGPVGSIADAFNATIAKLRQLVAQVQNVANQVNNSAQAGENSGLQVSAATLNQSREIKEALQAVEEINTSIQGVAHSATEAAAIARQALEKTKEGDQRIEQTVKSIENVRTAVAGTAKKVKRLAESSQEISQIVAIISGISEKTNLLAFNASIEASRAGEHGQGFRVVAEEVRRLADRVTEATKEIQQLVSGIQQETSSVLQAMENSTTEVVTGTELVSQTREILKNLAATSQEIDQYLTKISESTKDQTKTSEQVNQKIEEVADISEQTSAEVAEMVNSLRILAEQAQNLQVSVSQFRLQAEQA